MIPDRDHRTPAAEPTFLTFREAERRTGLSVRTLQRRVAEGGLPAYRHGRFVRLNVADLDALFALDTPTVGGDVAPEATR